ncbi:MAG: hypothetical protein JXR68_05695 [Bacteroidales bacterium]|nr:hypothetical protein [Bacteroidales bacterium]
MKKNIIISIFILIFFGACKNNSEDTTPIAINNEHSIKEVELVADLSDISDNQKKMIKLFIIASNYIDSMFFYENLENFQAVLNNIQDETLKKKFIYNFGPWDRFNQNLPFIDGFDAKPLGGNFYPSDMTPDEFKFLNDDKKNWNYTFIRRDSLGNLIVLPYHLKFKNYIDTISSLLNQAAYLSDNQQFSEYLREKAIALQTDNYFKSDSIWVNLVDNDIDFIIGPTYVLDDKLFNLKAEHQSFVLIKDVDWTNRMKKYNKWLKFLQKAIPVSEEYRAEEPGANSSIVVYDALYYGGSGKCGGTLLSVVFPLDPKIQIEQGVKNVQFKNIIEFKFNSVAKPISDVILTDNQKVYLSQEAFFINTILYEMGGSLGIRNTINNNGTVRNALRDYFTIADYIKNYTLSLFLAEKLSEVGEIENDLKENYFTFVVDLIRLIRFGLQNDYAVSNLVFYNYLVETKAITYDGNGHIVIDYENMKTANNSLTTKIIVMQGNGDYDGLKSFIEKYKVIDVRLQNLINSINDKNIPTDMILVQGEDVLQL